MALKSITVDNLTFDISYEIINPVAKHDFVVLHGWGSNKEIMKSAFKDVLKNFRHIYIDMPGFGKSSNEYVLETKNYAKIVAAFLDTINASKLLIAGHSFGGKVATLLHPDNLVLLSSAGIIEKKSKKVKFKIAMAKLFNASGLTTVNKSLRSKDVEAMSENMYETFKNVVDEDFSRFFENYKGNTLVFWGKDDTATSLSSGEKISSLIKNSTFKVYEGNHYFFCDNAKDIAFRIENAIH